MVSKYTRILTKEFLQQCFDEKKTIKDISKEASLEFKRIRKIVKSFKLKEYIICKYCGKDTNLIEYYYKDQLRLRDICWECKKEFTPNIHTIKNKKIITVPFINKQFEEKKTIEEIAKEFKLAVRVLRKFCKDNHIELYHKCVYCKTDQNLHHQIIRKIDTIFNVCKSCKAEHNTNMKLRIDSNGLNSYQRASIKTRQTKLTNIDENGLNSYQRGKIKQKENNLKNYGNENYNNPDKANKTKIERYGIINPSSLKVGTKHSKISQELFWGIYNNLPIELQKHTYFAKLNREMLLKNSVTKRSYQIDFYISNINFVLEFFGDYWHALNYSDLDSNIKPFKFSNITVAEIWKKDVERMDNIDRSGFYTFIVYESDFRKDKKYWIDYATEDILQFYAYKKQIGEI